MPVGAKRHTGQGRVTGERDGLADRSAGLSVPYPHCAVPLPETMRCPSGLNATLVTASEWPPRAPMVSPVSAFHSCTAPSSLPELAIPFHHPEELDINIKTPLNP